MMTQSIDDVDIRHKIFIKLGFNQSNSININDNLPLFMKNSKNLNKLII